MAQPNRFEERRSRIAKSFVGQFIANVGILGAGMYAFANPDDQNISTGLATAGIIAGVAMLEKDNAINIEEKFIKRVGGIGGVAMSVLCKANIFLGGMMSNGLDFNDTDARTAAAGYMFIGVVGGLGLETASYLENFSQLNNE